MSSDEKKKPTTPVESQVSIVETDHYQYAKLLREELFAIIAESDTGMENNVFEKAANDIRMDPTSKQRCIDYIAGFSVGARLSLVPESFENDDETVDTVFGILARRVRKRLNTEK